MADLIVAGRKIGTFTDWDQIGDWDASFDGFVPIAGVTVPAGYIAVLYEVGIIECYNKAGHVTHRSDLLDVVRDLPRSKPIAPIGELHGDVGNADTDMVEL